MKRRETLYTELHIASVEQRNGRRQMRNLQCARPGSQTRHNNKEHENTRKGEKHRKASTDALQGFEPIYLFGDIAQPSALRPERISAIPPHAFGDAIDVPFMSCRPCWVHWGTGAMAPPGADMSTPIAPSAVGPLLDHVYCCPYIHKPWTSQAVDK